MISTMHNGMNVADTTRIVNYNNYESNSRGEINYVSESMNRFEADHPKMFIEQENLTLIYSRSQETGELESYIKAESTDPLRTSTIGELVDMAAENFPDSIAISQYEGRDVTYHELLEEVNQLILGYISLGLEKGDHIGIWSPNSIEWCLSFWAAVKIGLVAVNLNPNYEGPELKKCLNDSDVKALIMSENVGNRNLYDTLSGIIPELKNYEHRSSIRNEAIPTLETVIVISETPYRGTYRFNDLMKHPTEAQLRDIQRRASEVKINDVCNIIFTSGTTSMPKGAQLTHFNLVNNSYYNAKRVRSDKEKNIQCILVPFFHSFGLMLIVSNIHFGSTTVIPFQKYNPSRVLSALIDKQCTIVTGTPTMFIDILTVFDKEAKEDPSLKNKFHPLKYMLTGGSLCLPEIYYRLKNTFNVKQILPGYGMTETSPTTFLAIPESPDDIVSVSVGLIMPHIEAKVVDRNGRIVPMNTPGELCIRGYTVMKGYYKELEKTKKTITEDGWLATGDQFVLNKDGYASIIGRIKDTILRGGENIEPLEIEDVIIKHPSVEDVHVYGVNDMRLGEVVAASIKLKPNEYLTIEDVRKYCKGKIAPFKIPQHIRFVDSYPKTATGKVQKHKLRAMLENELGL